MVRDKKLHDFMVDHMFDNNNNNNNINYSNKNNKIFILAGCRLS